MPKRRADSILATPSKFTRDWHVVRSEQSDFVIEHGFVPSVACEYCQREGLECVMDRSRRYSKCASCTRQGRTCRREFHTGEEWDMLKQAEAKVASDLSAADDELELLNPELELHQSRLAEVQNKIKITLARHSRLRKQQNFLKERGFKMSDHDTELLRILDEKSSEQPDPPVVEVQQLAATSDNPSFSQMVAEIDQMPPSFWDGLDLSSVDNPALPGGIPSSSQ